LLAQHVVDLAGLPHFDQISATLHVTSFALSVISGVRNPEVVPSKISIRPPKGARLKQSSSPLAGCGHATQTASLVKLQSALRISSIIPQRILVRSLGAHLQITSLTGQR
jgi:hypothetical protein